MEEEVVEEFIRFHRRLQRDPASHNGWHAHTARLLRYSTAVTDMAAWNAAESPAFKGNASVGPNDIPL